MRSGKVVNVVDAYPDIGDGQANRDRVNWVVIEHNGGYRSAYLHLQQGFRSRTGIQVGMPVSAGQLIGYSGNSGWSTEPHLHAKVHKGVWGDTVPFQIG
jgi:murein DD-endopeptidase MepM/ murein hydrolase activator NlpD